MIEVTEAGGGDPMEFDVKVREGQGESRHRVTAARRDLQRLAPDALPADCIEAAFRFLLEREPKESILSRFDLMTIARYFPEFEAELPRYFGR